MIKNGGKVIIIMKNLINFFDYENYPKTHKEAEYMATELGFDTIVCITDKEVFIGRSKYGIWSVGMPQEFKRIVMLISYENKYNRKIVFWSDNFEKLIELKKIIDNNFNTEQENEITVSEEDKFLCHSTTLDSFINIINDGLLLSYSELIKRKRTIKTVRHILNEPIDYFDYVDLCSWNSVSSEIVIASNQAGRIQDEISIIYNPGIRIYFLSETIKKVEGFCSDGLHIGMIHKSLPLKFSCAFVVPNKDEFCKAIYNRNLKLDDEIYNKLLYLKVFKSWTPQEFINESNKLVRQLKL